MEKLIDGVRVYKVTEGWECDWEDYKKAMKEQNKEWSEETFVKFCDEYDLFSCR